MRTRAGLALAAALLVGSAVLAALLISFAPEPTRQEPPAQIPFVQTGSVRAGVGAIPVHGAGTVRPGAEVGIAPQVGGRVVWVDPAFRSGGLIREGQTMFRLEETDYLHRLREAEADLAARQVAFLEAQEEAALARTDYEQFSGRQPEAGAPAPEAGPLALREPQLNAARAALDRDESRVASAELALSRTRVNAPFDGYVRDESVDVGQLVAAGESVGWLFAADAVEVMVPLSDSDAALIPGLWDLPADGPGDRAEARVFAEYGGGRYAWTGYVDRVEAALDEQTRTIDLIVRVPDPFAAGVPENPAGGAGGNPPLLVGKFVQVQFQGIAPENWFRAPRPALRPGNEVWAVEEDGVIDIVPVLVLQRADGEAFVTGDLQDGQKVITGGIQFATEGMRVRTDPGPVQ